MRLYIGNATAQRFQFNYRMLERPDVKSVMIERGFQSQIGGEMSREDVDYIIEKNRVYGLVPIEEAERTGGFSGLAFSVDRPITVDRLKRAMLKRTDVLVEVGHEARRNAALGTHDLVERQLAEHRELGASVVRSQMEIVEQDPSGGRRAATGGMQERFDVVRTGVNAPKLPQGKRGKRAA